MPQKKRTRKKAALPKSTVRQLEREYRSLEHLAVDFSAELVRQLAEVIHQTQISLAVPLEHRVKSWTSIAQKLERKELLIESVQALGDFVGVRAILLFRRDVVSACEAIEQKFRVLSREDTLERLGDSHFGYSSIHFTVEVPIEWLAVPTLARFAGLKAELQVRTVAQHLWAATSHVLQYKQEASVPPPLRRAVYRVSALLEMIDLEFERVLADRAAYKLQLDSTSEEETLNVDSLDKVLAETLPAQNRTENEDFAELLEDLAWFGVCTPEALRQIISRHRKAALRADDRYVKSQLAKQPRTTDKRTLAGAFYSQSGLIRWAMGDEFAIDWGRYIMAQWSYTTQLPVSTEARKVLSDANITVLPALVAKSEAELMRYNGMTQPLLDEIKEALKPFGLTFGMGRAAALSALIGSGAIETKAAQWLKDRGNLALE